MSRKSRAESAASMDSAAGDVAEKSPPPVAAKTRRRAIPPVTEPADPPEIIRSAIVAAAESGGEAVYREIPLDRVHPSPLNPRKTLPDPAADERMALSIAQKGILQPLLVRPSKQLDIEGEQFELIIGSRRYRGAVRARAGVTDPATGVLWQLPADYQIPVRVRECGDDELVILAGIENFDREDMDPLDEAELFAAVRPHVTPAAKPDGTTETREAAIARLFHIGERTVFRRLALTRLAPELAAAMRDKAITLGQAQAFALGHHNDQRRHWKLIKGDDQHNDWRAAPDRIRATMTAERIPVDRALFDPALYQGGHVADHETGEAWFTDPGEFGRLQELALRAKAAELETQWHWVEIVRGHIEHSKFETYGVKKSDPEAGAILQMDPQLRVTIHAPALRMATVNRRRATGQKRAAGGKGEPEKAPPRPLTEAQIRTIHAAKTRALRRAVCADHRAALALACLGLLGARDVRGLQPGHENNRVDFASGDKEADCIHHLVATAALDLGEKKRPKPGELPEFAGYHGDRDRAEPDRWFAALLTLSDEDLAELFRRLLAERIGSWAGYAAHNPPWYGDGDLAITIAETTNAAEHLPALWQPDVEFFKAYSRDRLVALARDQLRIRNADKMKKGEIAALCAEQPKGFWTPDRFPELRFQPEKAAEHALALVLDPAAPPPRSDEDMLAELRGLLAKFDNAVLAGGDTDTLARRVEDLLEEFEDREAAAIALRAAPGRAPLWGQPGEFRIELADGDRTIPILVVTEGLFGLGNWQEFEARAIDPELPFLNESGVESFDFSEEEPEAIDIASWALAEIRRALLIGIPGGEKLKQPRPLVPLADAARGALRSAAASAPIAAEPAPPVAAAAE